MRIQKMSGGDNIAGENRTYSRAGEDWGKWWVQDFNDATKREIEIIG